MPEANSKLPEKEPEKKENKNKQKKQEIRRKTLIKKRCPEKN